MREAGVFERQRGKLEGLGLGYFFGGGVALGFSGICLGFFDLFFFKVSHWNMTEQCNKLQMRHGNGLQTLELANVKE